MRSRPVGLEKKHLRFVDLFLAARVNPVPASNTRIANEHNRGAEPPANSAFEIRRLDARGEDPAFHDLGCFSAHSAQLRQRSWT